MTWLDAVVVAGIALSGLSGLMAGLWKEVFSFAAVFVGIVLAGRYSASLGHALTFISDPTAAQIVGFVIIFILVMIAGAIAAALMSRLFSTIGLGCVDKLGGLALGILEGIAILGFILGLASHVPVSSVQTTIDGSAAAHFVIRVFNFFAGLLPGGSWTV